MARQTREQGIKLMRRNLEDADYFVAELGKLESRVSEFSRTTLNYTVTAYLRAIHDTHLELDDVPGQPYVVQEDHLNITPAYGDEEGTLQSRNLYKFLRERNVKGITEHTFAEVLSAAGQALGSVVGTKLQKTEKEDEGVVGAGEGRRRQLLFRAQTPPTDIDNTNLIRLSKYIASEARELSNYISNLIHKYAPQRGSVNPLDDEVRIFRSYTGAPFEKPDSELIDRINGAGIRRIGDGNDLRLGNNYCVYDLLNVVQVIVDLSRNQQSNTRVTPVTVLGNYHRQITVDSIELIRARIESYIQQTNVELEEAVRSADKADLEAVSGLEMDIPTNSFGMEGYGAALHDLARLAVSGKLSDDRLSKLVAEVEKNYDEAVDSSPLPIGGQTLVSTHHSSGPKNSDPPEYFITIRRVFTPDESETVEVVIEDFCRGKAGRGWLKLEYALSSGEGSVEGVMTGAELTRREGLLGFFQRRELEPFYRKVGIPSNYVPDDIMGDLASMAKEQGIPYINRLLEAPKKAK